MTGKTGGYILLPVILALLLTAVLAFLLNRQGAVNLSVDEGTRLRDQVHYAAEGGIEIAQWEIQDGSCTGYTFPGGTLGGATLSGLISPTASSPVSITSTATLPDGTARTVTRSGVVVYQGELTATLQRGVATVRDTYVNAQAKTTNYGANTLIGVDMSGAHDYYALLRFELPVIPLGAELLSAQLVMNLASFGGNGNAKFTVYRMLSDWTEGTGIALKPGDGATYATSDGATSWSWPACYASASPVTTSPVNPAILLPPYADAKQTWDLTPLVQGWLDGTIPNYGFVIVGNNQARDVFFSSSESATETQRPCLVLTYSCECGVGSSSGTLTLQPGAEGSDSYVINKLNDVAHGGSADLFLAGAAGAANAEHVLMKFDLSGIPSGAVVSLAQLALNGFDVDTPPAGADVMVYRMVKPWDETKVTYQTPDGVSGWVWPGNYDGATLYGSSTLLKGVTGWVTWEITSLVQGWHEGTVDNNGMVLVGTSGLYWSAFYSSDSANSALRPKLTVSYYCPCGVECLSGGRTYRDEFNSLTCDAAVDYSGSDGTLDWTPRPWVETGETTDSCNGAVKIKDDGGENRLALSETGKGILRPVDLSAFSKACLRFDYLRQELDDDQDSVFVMAMPTDVAVVAILGELKGPGTDTVPLQASFDLTPFVGGDLQLIFSAKNLAATGDAVFIDNLEIAEEDCTVGAIPTVTLNPVADTWIDQNDISTPHGADTRMQIGADAGGKLRTVLLKFDVSTLPSDATVVSAKLRLYNQVVTGTKIITIQVFRQNAAWSEATATWSSTGGGSFDLASPLAAATFLQAPGEWVEWTLPNSLVYDWYANTANNNGLLVRYVLEKKNLWVNPVAKENTATEFWPQLVIEYSMP